MTDLFALDELASYLQQDLDTSTAAVARRVASGWLQSATRLTEWPVPVPDALFGWALELAAIAWRNPDGAASETVDDHTAVWDRARRGDILAAARQAYSGATAPVHSFPDVDWHWDVVPTVTTSTA